MVLKHSSNIASHMKRRGSPASLIESRKIANQPLPRRPQLRLLAAMAMLGFLIAGVGAIALGALVGLGNETATQTIALFASTAPAGSTAIHSIGLWLRTLLGQHPFLTLMSFAAVLMLIAYLLRKSVLVGLRD